MAAFRRALMADPCAYCGVTPDVLDHVVAKARRGGDALENRAPACRRCNADKSDTSLLGFLARRAVLGDYAVVLAEAQHARAWALELRRVGA